MLIFDSNIFLNNTKTPFRHRKSKIEQKNCIYSYHIYILKCIHCIIVTYQLFRVYVYICIWYIYIYIYIIYFIYILHILYIERVLVLDKLRYPSKISDYIDYHLQQIVNEIPSYIQDATNFLRKINFYWICFKQLIPCFSRCKYTNANAPIFQMQKE